MNWQSDGTEPRMIGEVHNDEEAKQLVAQTVQELVAEGGRVIWQPHEYCAIVRFGSVDWYIYEMDCSTGDKVQMQRGRMVK